MPNPYVILFGTIAVLLAIGAAGVKGYSLGADHIRAEWSAQKLAEATEYAAKIKELTDRTRAQEAQSALRQAATAKQLQVEQANHETTRRAVDHRLESGELVLRDRFAAAVSACGSGGATVARAGQPDHAGAAGELSAKTSGFLVGLASEADQVAAQLSACQALVRSDRL